MAGPAHRGSRGRGRSPRATSLPPSSRAAAPRVAIGATVIPSPATAAAPDADPVRRAAEGLVTASTFRLLLLRGLTPREAANLTAFLCGIPIAEVHWSLRQVNHLLFLRELARTGRFGAGDGGPIRPH